MIDGAEGIEGFNLQVRPGAGDTPEQNDTILISNQCHGVDRFRRWILLQQLCQGRKRLLPAQSPKGTGSRKANLRFMILEALHETLDHLGIQRDTATSGGTQTRIIVLEKLRDQGGWQNDLEARGTCHRFAQ